MRAKEAFLGGITVGSGVMGCIVQSTGGLLHLFTTFVAFSESGFLAGVVTFFLPVLSEIYWLIRIGPLSGYGLIVLTWVGLLILAFAGIGLASFLGEKE